MVGGQDELVFDGGSVLLNPAGEIISRGKAFEEDLIITDLYLEETTNFVESNTNIFVSNTFKNKNPFLFKNPADKKTSNSSFAKAIIEPIPLYLFKDTFNVNLISKEMKYAIRRKIDEKNIANIFIKMRKNYPLRSDFDSTSKMPIK